MGKKPLGSGPQPANPEEMTLGEWLAKMRDPKQMIIRQRFPNESCKDEYLATIAARANETMKKWLESIKIRKCEHFRRFLSLCFFCAFLSSFVFALDRDRTLAQFHHTAWTAKDGAPSQISALAQTEDGYLWIGSARGLFRFDGVEFEPCAAPGGVTLPSHNIYSLMATPDGGLWISFNPSGIGFLK